MSIRLLLSVPSPLWFLPTSRRKASRVLARNSHFRATLIARAAELRAQNYFVQSIRNRCWACIGEQRYNLCVQYHFVQYKIQTYIQTDNNKEIFIYLIFNQRYSVVLHQRHLHSTLLVTAIYIKFTLSTSFHTSSTELFYHYNIIT